MIEFIKRFTKDFHFDLFLNAGIELGIKFFFLIPGSPTGYFEKNGKKLFIESNKIGCNNFASSKISENKSKSYQVLKRFGLPFPNYILARNDDDSKKVFEKAKNVVGERLVTKPNIGSNGDGVSVDLKNFEDFERSLRKSFFFHRFSLVEEYFEGRHFRIIVFRDKIIDIIERVPPKVCGDGESTIKSLIERENEKRKKYNSDVILVDDELIRNLKDSGLSMESVLLPGKEVWVRKNCNLATGGLAKRIKISTFHSENLELFLKINEIFGLEFSGIDFICPNPENSYKNQRAVINEINSSPMLGANFSADYKMDNFVAREILRLYFDI
mgnify:CR=1 FL=1